MIGDIAIYGIFFVTRFGRAFAFFKESIIFTGDFVEGLAFEASIVFFFLISNFLFT